LFISVSASSHDEEDIVSFLEEGLIMKEFDHCNVLKLRGICFGEDNLPIIILPCMQNGDLLSFISDSENMITVRDLEIFALGIAKGS
jgi:proto-oncogene tyrosine-protein kinase Met